MNVIVREPHADPRKFDTLNKARAYMKAKAVKQMAWCRKYANDSTEAVGDLLSAIEGLNDTSFEYGPVKLGACVDNHTGVKMQFEIGTQE